MIILLIYLFLGIAIISDIFMGAIEVITSYEREVKTFNPITKQHEVKSVKIWNDTVANLSLMALGSSAPEILLAVCEALLQIISGSEEPGELGPSTIVGSAAFNLLFITAVCIHTIPEGEVRRIDQINVFIMTSTISLWAYIWMYIVLDVWTPDFVTIPEAVLTLLMFIMLLFLS
jgi:solute carrier family 8 (sodium/calcium exchanger)